MVVFISEGVYISEQVSFYYSGLEVDDTQQGAGDGKCHCELIAE